jgi:hypothetical protein
MAEIRAIWKDTYVEFNTENSPVDYTIYIKSEGSENDYKDIPIFNGKAWCPPAHNTELYKSNINKICEDYVFNDMANISPNAWSGTFINSDSLKTFYVTDDNNVKLKEVSFIYDWSYDDSINYEEGKETILSRPINGRGANGMFHFRTRFDGTKIVTNYSKTPSNGYEEVTNCTDNLWALYYLNRYGGWDSYLIEGYVSKKDNYERKGIIKPFDNNTNEMGNKPYLTNITTTYEIHTGWMNDRESERLAESVFQTTRAYLHNLETGEFFPVVITDADVVYKNHKNSGRRLLNYTINAEKSQTEYNKN